MKNADFIEKNGTGIEKNGTGIEKNGTGIEKNGTGLWRVDKNRAGIHPKTLGIMVSAALVALTAGNASAEMRGFVSVKGSEASVTLADTHNIFSGRSNVQHGYALVGLNGLKSTCPAFAIEVGGHGTGSPDVGGHGTGKPSVGGHGTGKPTVGGHGTGSPTVGGHGTGSPNVGGHGTGSPNVGGHGTGSPDVGGHGTGVSSSRSCESILVGGHGTGRPDVGGHGTGAPNVGGHGTGKPNVGGHGTGKPAVGGHGTGSPMVGGHGTGSPNVGGHGTGSLGEFSERDQFEFDVDIGAVGPVFAEIVLHESSASVLLYETGQRGRVVEIAALQLPVINN